MAAQQDLCCSCCLQKHKCSVRCVCVREKRSVEERGGGDRNLSIVDISVVNTKRREGIWRKQRKQVNNAQRTTHNAPLLSSLLPRISSSSSSIVSSASASASIFLAFPLPSNHSGLFACENERASAKKKESKEIQTESVDRDSYFWETDRA